MTEYTSSSEAIREYMSSRERTAVWVQSHAPLHSEFYSPSIAPSVLDDVVIPSTPPSEAESTRSVPPKMVLKYTDGRPDVPISNWHDKGLSRSKTRRRAGDSSNRSHTLPYERNGRSRSASHDATELDWTQRDVSVRHQELQDPQAFGSPTPEEIRVWPSHEPSSPPQHSQHTPRSKSLPRDTRLPDDPQSPPLPIPSHAQLQQRIAPPSHHSHSTPPTHQVSFSQSQPIAWHSLPSPSKGAFTHNSSHSSSQKSSSHTPPAIVYAPSNHSRAHYVPPAMYTQYPPPNAPGMTYSHSAPVRYPHVVGTPYPSVHGASTVLSSVHEEQRSSRIKGARPLAVTATEDDSSETDSNRSGSTYYVIPTAGQKVHIIAPDKSIYTATSTTKSPTSPRSPVSGSLKKPFFSRLLERFSASDSSRAFSSGGHRRLQRRHSTGGTVRNPPIDQREEH